MLQRINSVQELGVLVRATRKNAGVRIDDLASSAGLSKQFVNDLELGKETVRLGKVLQALADLGIYLSVDVPLSTLKTLPKSQEQIQRTTARRSKRSATGQTGAALVSSSKSRDQ